LKVILQAKGLNKEFDGNKVLKGIDLTVEEGEFLAVMGQTGSGKSTLLYNLSGIDRKNSGEIYFNGIDITQLNDEDLKDTRLKGMGFIFQQTRLYKSLSIRENIISPALKANKKSRDEINEYSVKLMKHLGIYSIANKAISDVTLSQLQRTAICRALINKPDIIFGDEPTGELNSIDSKDIMDILNEVNSKGTTVIVVTRDTKVAVRADRVVFLSNGIISEQITLGRYREKQFAERIKKLSAWVEKQIF